MLLKQKIQTGYYRTKDCNLYMESLNNLIKMHANITYLK